MTEAVPCKGVASPRKKKVDFRPSPRRRAAPVPAPIDVDSTDGAGIDNRGNGAAADEDLSTSLHHIVHFLRENAVDPTDDSAVAAYALRSLPNLSLMVHPMMPI